MHGADIDKRIHESIVLLDGAIGTELQRMGLPAGICPEYWALEHAEILYKIHRAYIKAGSNVITTNTFGANREKLRHHGLADQVREINERNAGTARKAAGSTVLTAGSIGPSGRLPEPGGDFSIDEAYDCFQEQIRGLLNGGVDIILLETMIDIQEARCALLAAKDLCDLPVWVSMTFENGHTLTGSDPVTALITLQAMGACVVGTNCGNGPAQMVSIIESMAENATVPLLVQPNAGVPQTHRGRTVYNLSPGEFSGYAEPLLKSGASVFGGCCGTNPEFIRGLAGALNHARPRTRSRTGTAALTSRTRTVFLEESDPLVLIGDQLNPSGKKILARSLAKGDIGPAREIGSRMAKQGANAININVGVPGADQTALMKKLTLDLSISVNTPLAFDSAGIEPIQEALKLYPGRALINSISGEKVKRERLLPLVLRYGAMFVLMPLNEQGVPRDAQTRLAIIKDVVAEAESMGIDRSSIIVDGLVLAESAKPGSARETLEVIRTCNNELGLATMCGLSNVSFGLPNRPWMDAAFLAMCVEAGIRAVNANPGSEHHRSIIAACDVLTGRDPNAAGYVNLMLSSEPSAPKKMSVQLPRESDVIRDAVVNGYMDTIRDLVADEIGKGRSPMDIITASLIPAVTEIGDRFSRGEIFLPQLVISSNAAQEAFTLLEHHMPDAEDRKKGTILLATVKGDVHDIGKNLVGTLLKSNGFQVVDLGIDVPAEKILATALDRRVDIIGLSALMTTTMNEMKDVVRLGKKTGPTGFGYYRRGRGDR